MKTIILFKADTTENSYENLLQQEHLNVISIKTIDFEYRNLNQLKLCLDAPEKYSGIIFTSPRCVTSVAKALNGDILHEQWKTKKNYGIGPKTVAYALNTLRLECLGADAGNAQNLGDIILQNKDDLPLLYPKGNLAKDTLKQKVSNTEDVIVYNTVTSVTIEKDLTVATNDFKLSVDFVVFFSPSGVKALVPYLQKLQHDQLKVIAIGPTTEVSLQELNIPVAGTCETPSAEGLIHVITKI